MTTNPLTIVVDARYACDVYPGIGRVVIGLANAWATHPEVARLHLLTNPRRSNTHLHLPTASERVILHNVTGRPDSRAEGQAVRRLTNSLAADWFYTPYLRLPWGHFIPHTLVTVHDAIPLTNAMVPLHTRIGYAAALLLVAARATALTTVSQAAADSIAPFVWPHRHPAVIPNGIDAQFYTPVATGDLSAHGIGGPYVLCVSSNQPHKNLATLVAAWRILIDTAALPPAATLVIAGQFNPKRICPWLSAADLPIVAIPSPDDQLLRQLYRSAEFVVQPSLAEGFGLPVYEALACGCAVLCNDLPVYTQSIATAVVMADLTTPASLAAAIATLWNDSYKRSQLALAGPSFARRFDWDTAAALAVEIMHKNTPRQ